MDIDGARNAKAEIFQRAFRYSEMPSAFLADDETPVFTAEGSPVEIEIRRARAERTLALPEQIAVGILRRPGDADRAGPAQVGIFVQRKRLIDHPIVEAARRIVRRDARIIVTGPVRVQAGNTARCRPLRIGASVSHFRSTAGTVGCFAKSRRTGAIGLVSNNHVLARINGAAVGDAVLQPGRIDGPRDGARLNRVASLGDFVPIDFAPNAPNYVDCAFAPLIGEPGHDGSTIGALGSAAPTCNVGQCEDLIDADIHVHKVGRSTGPTRGLVEAISVDNLTVQMETGPKPKYALFHRQIAITGEDRRFSKPGDSGSLIYLDNGNPVGLLFAGTRSGGRTGRGITYANPIQPVLDALDVELYTDSAGGSDV